MVVNFISGPHKSARRMTSTGYLSVLSADGGKSVYAITAYMVVRKFINGIR